MKNINELLRNPKELLQNPAIIKQLAVANRVFFSKYYLGMDTPPHQKKWHALIDTAFRDLLLAPRDHGKSTVINYEWPVHEICRNPDVRILQISKTQGQAKKFLALVSEELTTNQKLIKDFSLDGNSFKSNQGWRSDFIFVKRNKKMKDPTLEACGVEGAITGGHFDIIIADDIIDEENTKTAERMTNVLNWFFGTIGQLAEPHTIIFLVGTRKHYADLYNHIMTKKKGYRVHIDRAIVKWPTQWTYLVDRKTEQVIGVETEGTYKVLWPEKWNIKTLLLDRLNSGRVLFDREKQNDPTGMRGRFFNKEWLQYYIEMPEFRMIVQGMDLAISENPDADYTVLLTLGITMKNKIYILDYTREHLTFDQQVKLLLHKHQQWSPNTIYIEKNQYQQALYQHIRDNSTLPVVPVQTVKDKATRMLGISPYFEQRRIYIRDTMVEFEKEYLQFPKSEHDDILDALDIALTPIKQNTRPIDRSKLKPTAISVYK